MLPQLEQLDGWLARNRPAFHKNLNKPAAAAVLKSLEKTVKSPLPEVVQKWLSWHDGQGEAYVGFFFDHWLMMSAEKIAAAKVELDAAGGDMGWRASWLPLFDDDGGNFACIDLTRPASPFFAFWAGAKPTAIAGSFAEWIGQYVTDVLAGQFFEEPERGTFSKTNSK